MPCVSQSAACCHLHGPGRRRASEVIHTEGQVSSVSTYTRSPQSPSRVLKGPWPPSAPTSCLSDPECWGLAAPPHGSSPSRNAVPSPLLLLLPSWVLSKRGSRLTSREACTGSRGCTGDQTGKDSSHGLEIRTEAESAQNSARWCGAVKTQ